MALAVAGCTRTRYRFAADRDAYCILDEKSAETPWRPPAGFDLQVDPRSRLFDPTCPDDPALPIPGPRLYAYEIPSLRQHDPSRFYRSSTAVEVPPQMLADASDACEALAALVAFQQEAPRSGARTSAVSAGLRPSDTEPSDTVLKARPIPSEVWESLPKNCLMRMFEFTSIRTEYEDSFGREPAESLRDPSRRLALEDIVELALLNSREYQAQKENLYRAALALSLERFDFYLNFAAAGNGTGVEWDHNRIAGTTVDRLSVPSAVSGGKVLACGGDLLARFANDVILTFNGPEGFAADVGSELLLDLSQSVFQRDVAFESLTQAERNVVYAARDFARFRKQLFQSLASDYYNLLLTYRGIEIDTNDYFSNLRAFNQGQAEHRAGKRSRIEVDQFEQNALRSRSGLIGSCNSLESSFDRLKLNVGLPPETPVNLNLTELELLTLRDEVTVSNERVLRARRNLVLARQAAAVDHFVLLNGAIDLANRMLALADLKQRMDRPHSDVGALELLHARLSVKEARLRTESNRTALAEDKAARPPKPPVQIFRRTMDLIDSETILIGRQLELAACLSADAAHVERLRTNLGQLTGRLAQIRADLRQIVADEQLNRIPDLIAGAGVLLTETDDLVAAADALTQYVRLTPQDDLRRTLAHVDRALAESQGMLAGETGGLVPVEIDVDDAMLTALSQRFDLMNERGALADTWRRIKLAGDDLKSILNLHATQAIRTRFNRPFGFTFDESETRLGLTFDTPLNRHAQRNLYRNTLIDYQAALRNLMEAEDDIKAAVRDDLRQLQLDREQYRIAVASAALAYERVVSTRLQLQLGRPGVAARDFLEAQQAFTGSLNAVAAEHIRYIRDRIQLFIDLESLEVDDEGFWPELYDERFQPTPSFHIPTFGRPVYGELPCHVHYSRDVQRMLAVPAGTAEVLNPPASE